MTGPDYFLGVDGGGTKTRFALIGHHGRLLAEAQLGTTYHPQVGLDGVREVLARGIDEVLHTASIAAADISHAFFGLPAFGEDSSMVPRLRALPGAILGHDRYACDNDMVCGWAGSLGCADGINIVAGTGSIGYGQRQGRAARAGGWGEAFSDEGSAYWIAIQGLNKYSRMSDGRLPEGLLHSMLLHFAALQFEPGEVALVSGSGGAFNTGHLLLTPFREALDASGHPFDLVQPLYEPHVGAALYAARLAGTPVVVRTEPSGVTLRGAG